MIAATILTSWGFNGALDIQDLNETYIMPSDFSMGISPDFRFLFDEAIRPGVPMEKKVDDPYPIAIHVSPKKV